jgi:hypothetical protein
MLILIVLIALGLGAALGGWTSLTLLELMTGEQVRGPLDRARSRGAEVDFHPLDIAELNDIFRRVEDSHRAGERELD